jgi:hypothetical protein
MLGAFKAKDNSCIKAKFLNPNRGGFINLSQFPSETLKFYSCSNQNFRIKTRDWGF